MEAPALRQRDYWLAKATADADQNQHGRRRRQADHERELRRRGAGRVLQKREQRSSCESPRLRPRRQTANPVALWPAPLPSPDGTKAIPTSIKNHFPPRPHPGPLPRAAAPYIRLDCNVHVRSGCEWYQLFPAGAATPAPSGLLLQPPGLGQQFADARRHQSIAAAFAAGITQIMDMVGVDRALLVWRRYRPDRRSAGRARAASSCRLRACGRDRGSPDRRHRASPPRSAPCRRPAPAGGSRPT